MKEQYYNLELSIMSCLLQRPELMENVFLEDKHFIKYRALWLYMKSFYEKFKTFDLVLMTSVSTNKTKFINYIVELLELEPAPSLFGEYQKTLIELYNQNKKEKEMIDNIYKLVNDLYFKKINLDDFKKELDDLYG